MKELHVYGQLNYCLQDQRAQMAEKTNLLVQKNRSMTTRVYYKSQTEIDKKSIILWEPGGYSMSKQGDHLFCPHISFVYFYGSQNKQYHFPTQH